MRLLNSISRIRLRLCLQFILFFSFLAFPAYAGASGAALADLQRAVQNQTDQTYPFPKALYQYFHSHPELSFQEKDLPSLHSSRFAPVTEPTLKTGVMTMATAALELFETR